MADELEEKEESLDEGQTESENESDAPLQEDEVDYKLLAEAEKARADAAEALIVKNKNIAKRKEGTEETQQLSEDRVLELIRQAKAEEYDSPESQALAEAQKNLKVIQAKNAEIARALKNKDNPQREVAGSQRDGEQTPQPKLPEGSPLKDYKHEGNGIYSKKLASGKTLKINTKATVGQTKKWIEESISQ